MHGSVLGAAHMHILSATGQHLGCLHEKIGKHMFDLQGNKQKKNGADRYRQIWDPLGCVESKQSLRIFLFTAIVHCKVRIFRKSIACGILWLIR